MQAHAPSATLAGRFGDALREAFVTPVIVLGIFTAIVIYGVSILPGGWAGDRAHHVTLTLLGLVWALGFLTRVFSPGSKLGALIETFCIFLSLSLAAALATSVPAIGGGEFVDPQLVAIDAAIAPFYDWRAVALALPEYPALYQLLSHTYASLNWQPFALMVAAFLFGRLQDMNKLVSGWALGMAGCILPFHFLPAQSPYIYYGITRDQMPGSIVALPWDFMPKFEAMRS